MEDYIINKPIYREFNYKEYNKTAMNMFYKYVCGDN